MESSEEFFLNFCTVNSLFHECPGHVLMPRPGVCWRSGGRDLVPETALGPHVATFLPAAGPLCPEMGEGKATAEGLEGSP